MVRTDSKKARMDTETSAETTNTKQRKMDDPSDNDLAVAMVMSNQIQGSF